MTSKRPRVTASPDQSRVIDFSTRAITFQGLRARVPQPVSLIAKTLTELSTLRPRLYQRLVAIIDGMLEAAMETGDDDAADETAFGVSTVFTSSSDKLVALCATRPIAAREVEKLLDRLLADGRR
jgi:hypothetical protein